MMLVLDPDRRISVSSALRHDYLKEYSVPTDEPVATEAVKASLVTTDRAEEQATTIDDWRELIWNEVRLFQTSARRLSFVSCTDNDEEPMKI